MSAGKPKARVRVGDDVMVRSPGGGWIEGVVRGISGQPGTSSYAVCIKYETVVRWWWHARATEWIRWFPFHSETWRRDPFRQERKKQQRSREAERQRLLEHQEREERECPTSERTLRKIELATERDALQYPVEIKHGAPKRKKVMSSSDFSELAAFVAQKISQGNGAPEYKEQLGCRQKHGVALPRDPYVEEVAECFDYGFQLKDEVDELQEQREREQDFEVHGDALDCKRAGCDDLTGSRAALTETMGACDWEGLADADWGDVSVDSSPWPMEDESTWDADWSAVEQQVEACEVPERAPGWGEHGYDFEVSSSSSSISWGVVAAHIGPSVRDDDDELALSGSSCVSTDSGTSYAMLVRDVNGELAALEELHREGFVGDEEFTLRRHQLMGMR